MSFTLRSRASAWIAVLAGSAALLLAVSACDGDGGQPAAGTPTEASGETPEPTEAEEPQPSESPELMLAVTNAGEPVDDDDPSVAEFRSILDTLEEKCPDERQEIADIGASTHKTVTEKGLDITLLQMMRDLAENIPDGLDDLGISCATAFAAYVQSEAPQ